ncbi:hypothetical protein TNCV_3961961 [Trichonephila clavipes]|nr:hypothetical protein TNCV_3961961 [Trichonephila clavipes]
MDENFGCRRYDTKQIVSPKQQKYVSQVCIYHKQCSQDGLSNRKMKEAPFQCKIAYLSAVDMEVTIIADSVGKQLPKVHLSIYAIALIITAYALVGLNNQ